MCCEVHKKKLKRHKKEKKFTRKGEKTYARGLTESFVFHTFVSDSPSVGASSPADEG